VREGRDFVSLTSLDFSNCFDLAQGVTAHLVVKRGWGILALTLHEVGLLLIALLQVLSGSFLTLGALKLGKATVSSKASIATTSKLLAGLFACELGVVDYTLHSAVDPDKDKYPCSNDITDLSYSSY
jgi:hypothetical protein